MTVKNEDLVYSLDELARLETYTKEQLREVESGVIYYKKALRVIAVKREKTIAHLKSLESEKPKVIVLEDYKRERGMI